MKRVAYSIAAVILIALTGCATRSTDTDRGSSAIAGVGIVNHTGQFIYSASANGAGGGNMSAWGAGSPSTCCVIIPRVWHPHMTVRVRWNMPIGIKDVIKEKIVEVEKYDRLGDVYLNFFPNDEVRVVVSRNGPRADDFPIPHRGKPDDAPEN